MEKKSKVCNVLFEVIVAAIIGFIFEAVYFIVGDIGLEKIDELMGNETYVGLFFFYLLIITVAVFALLVINCKRANKISRVVCGIVAVLAGLSLHMMCFEHDSVVYYHLHGKFMPLSDDLGYFFFMLYLGAVYIIWIPTSIGCLIYALKKRK